MLESEKRIDGKGIFPAEGERLALVVGVNGSIKLDHQELLKYAEDDAYEMAKALASSACNFTLLKSALQGKDATSNNVRDAILELIEKSTPQDFLCFYFSGHAQPMKVRGDRQDIYLVTHDFTEWQVERNPTHHLSMRWLWEMLYEQPNVGKILLILDCCYAGNMVAAGPDLYQIDLYQLFKNYMEGQDVKKQADRSRFILSATGHDAVAHECDGHGVMTGLLLEALYGEVTSVYDEEGYLDISEFYTYLLKAMPGQPPSRSIEGKDRFILAWRQLQPRDLQEETKKTSEEIIDLLAQMGVGSNKSPSLPFDHTLCKDATFAGVDDEAVTSFSREERVQNQPNFRSNLTNQGLLEQFNLLQDGFLTYGALLCFGEAPSKWIVGAYTRCTSWKGNSRLEGWKEDLFLRGNLLEQYELSIGFLRRNLHLSRVISAEGSIEQWEMPLVVLREALANALIHREYADQTNYVRVEIFDDRIEISSPGSLPDGLTILQLGKEEHYPIRNPQIAHIFYLCNYVEIYGTGISRMQQKMQEARLLQPQFETKNGRTFNVVLRRSPAPQRRVMSRRQALFFGLVGGAGAFLLGRSFLPFLWQPDTKPMASPTPVWSLLFTLRMSHTQPELITSIAPSPQGTWIASGGGANDHAIEVWDVRTNLQGHPYVGPSDRVNSIAWSADGQYLALASDDGKVYAWDNTTNKQIFVKGYTQNGNADGIPNKMKAVTWSQNNLLAMSGDNGIARICQMQGQKMVEVYAFNLGQVGDVDCTAWSPDGQYLAFGTGDTSEVQIWRIVDQTFASKPTRVLTLPHDSHVSSLIWVAQKNQLISATRGGLVSVWDMKDMPTKSLITSFSTRLSLSRIALHPDGTMLACLSKDAVLQLYDLNKNKLWEYPSNQGFVNSADWLTKKDGNDLVIGVRKTKESIDGVVEIWHIGS